jgi:hypothetical protein
MGAEAQFTKPPEAVKVAQPTAVVHKIDPRDSTYLRIGVSNIYYKASLLNDSLTTQDIKKLDKFISINQKRINKDKILVTGNPNVSYSRFKALNVILSKHQLYKFLLVSDPR